MCSRSPPQAKIYAKHKGGGKADPNIVKEARKKAEEMEEAIFAQDARHQQATPPSTPPPFVRRGSRQPVHPRTFGSLSWLLLSLLLQIPPSTLPFSPLFKSPLLWVKHG